MSADTDDRGHVSNFRTLDRDIPVRCLVDADERNALAAIGRRRDLERSEIHARLSDRIREMTGSLAAGSPEPPLPSGDRAFLRAVSWNLQRGRHVEKLASCLKEAGPLADADVLLLNEVDVGMTRSGNRNVAADLAREMGFYWVFGNSYLCLDFGDTTDGTFDVDNAVGMHGNAILSRYPILRAENFTVTISKDKFESSEKRLGHKKALWAEIDAPTGPLVVASVHLDSIASPDLRRRQMEDVTAALDRRGIRRALLGGDLNTNTYDVESVWHLLRNIGAKLVRGGFPHAIHHYMHPWELYESGVFDAMEAGGFDWRAFNALDRGTIHYEVGSFDSEAAVSDQLPYLAVRILRWKLKPWNGVAPLRTDWFAGRGLRVLHDGDRVEGDARECRSPSTLERPTVEGTRLSDHDPLIVDVAPAVE